MAFIPSLLLALLCSIPTCVFLTQFIMYFYKFEPCKWRRIFLISTAVLTAIMLLFLKSTN
jgi:hypothetical protein